MSEFYKAARDAANKAFDEHCNAWDALQKINEPTIQDIEDWLAARNKFYDVQEKFEKIVRQVIASSAT